jgi:hypothetical protein
MHHPVGDAAGEIVLEECPALPHHVPMALPANQVANLGGDRLIGHDVLRGQRQRPQHQQHQRHAEQHRPEAGEQRLGRARRDQGDDAAHENRDQRIEQRQRKAGREQSREQAFGLAGKMPIERDQPGRRLGIARDRGRPQQPLEQGKHDRLAKAIAPRGGVGTARHDLPG